MREAIATAIGMPKPFVRQAALLWSANLLATAFGFLVPLALARLSTPADYGRFSFITAVLATLAIVTLPGLNLAITQGTAREQDGTLRVAMKSRRRGGTLMSALVLVVGALMVAYGDRTTGWSFIVVSPLVMGAYALDGAVAFLNGRHLFRAMSVVLVGASVVPAAVVVTLLLLRAPIMAGATGYVLALAIVNVVSLNWSMRLVRNEAVDPELIRYGRRMTWISSLGALQFYLDRVIVGSSLGFVDLAVYSAAKLFQQGLKTTWAAVNQLLFPRLARAITPEAAHAMMWRTLGPIWMGFAALTAAASMLAPAIIALLLGEPYSPSVTPARVLMLAVLVGIPGAQFEMLFRATSDERRLYTQRLTFTFVEVAATGMGAVWYGTLGASVGMLIAYTVNSIVGFALHRLE